MHHASARDAATSGMWHTEFCTWPGCADLHYPTAIVKASSARGIDQHSPSPAARARTNKRSAELSHPAASSLHEFPQTFPLAQVCAQQAGHAATQLSAQQDHPHMFLQICAPQARSSSLAPGHRHLRMLCRMPCPLNCQGHEACAAAYRIAHLQVRRCRTLSLA